MVTIASKADVKRSITDQAKQLIKSLSPFVRTGIIEVTGPATTVKIVRAINKWGFSIASSIEIAAAKQPNRKVIIDDQGDLTYLELKNEVDALAKYLFSKGVQEGDTVALMARNSRAPIEALAALAKLGASAMIVNVASSLAQIEAILTENPVKAFIADEEFSEVAIKVTTPLLVFAAVDSGSDLTENSIAYIVKGDYANITLPKRPKQQPTVIMSSGTRGTPKGVVHPVPKTPKVLAGILNAIPWEKGLIIQQTSNFFHAWGWLNLQIGLATTSTFILRRIFNAEQSLQDAIKYKADAKVSAAVFLRDEMRVMEEQHLKPGPYKFILSSGNRVPLEVVDSIRKQFGDVLYSFYGSTEHGQIAIANTKHLSTDSSIVGFCTTGVSTIILKDDDSLAKPGEIGRIFSVNPNSMLGFVSSKDCADIVKGHLNTGDLGYLDKDGLLHVDGRSDDMVIKGGENIHLTEVQEILEKLEGISDCYVSGDNSDIVAKIIAYVVRDKTTEGKSLEDSTIKKFIGENLFVYAIPDEIVWLKKLPRNDNGKVVPRKLAESPRE